MKQSEIWPARIPSIEPKWVWLETISCFRFRAIRAAYEAAAPRHCSDEAFKNHWVEDDVHYLPGENLIDLSAAFMKQNGT